jgi:protein O-GlcNAc transferase
LARELGAAADHLRHGRLPEAATALRGVLAIDSRHPAALHHLGLIEHRLGNNAAAADLIGRSLSARPDHADALSDLSVILRELGRLDEAIAAAERAISLRPGHARAHTNLGNLLRQRGRLADAARAHATAVKLDPQSAAAHANLADALLAQNRAGEALAACDRALALAPQLAEAQGFRAQVLQRLGRNAEALTAYELALVLKPGLAALHTEIGNILRLEGRFEEAIAAHRRTIAAKPDCAEAWGHLAVTLQTLGRWSEAFDAYRKAIDLAPDFAEAYSNLGVLLQLMGKSTEAIAAYRTATRLNPRYGLAHFNLGGTLKDQERLEEAIGAFRQAIACEPDLAPARFQLCNVRLHACDWRGLEKESADCLASLLRDDVRVSPFPILAMSAAPAAHLEHTRLWARGLAVAPADVFPRRQIDAAPESRRIRLGYLSSDFQRHATGSLIAELLERHDRTRFEVLGYCFSADDGSDMRKRLLGAFDRFVDVRKLSYAEAARRIHDDGIDILVDLKGYTKDARTEILALRPAPLQVNFLGYPGSMGADFIDYILADAFVAPMDQQPHFTERIVHLPDCYQPNDRRRQIAPQAPSRAACGLPEKGFVFCSFNSAYKITEDMFGIWMRLLAGVPGSVLWLLDADALAKANLRREAVVRGVDPGRLVFAPKLRMQEHLARHGLADLFLDTLPVNAHTTASDALWAGLPVLTCAGPAFIGRVAGSLLQAVGLPELIVHTLADYEALALRLATDATMLRELRDRLDRNRLTAPLFDSERYARNIEAAYTHMVRLHAAGRPPEAFAVSDLADGAYSGVSAIA